MTHNEPAPSRPPLVDLATASALIAVWLYVLGWTYALHYFARFEVGLLALEIPYEYYLMYGSWVVRSRWGAVATLVTVMLLVGLWQPIRALYRKAVLYLFLVLAATAFSLAPTLASDTANQHYKAWSHQGFQRYPSVKVWIKSTTAKSREIEQLTQALPEGCHRVLLHSKNKLFLFRPRLGANQARLAVVVLPLSEVQALRIIPEFESCP